MTRTLHRSVAVVTGAAHGIGAATSRELVRRGASVAMLDCDAPAVKDLAAELGSRAIAFEADVTERASLDEAVNATLRHYGGFDVVVANAGIAGPTAPVSAVDAASFERTLDINLLGTWRTIQVTLPHVIEQRGYILSTASMASALPSPTMAAYGVSKSGIDALGRALRLELASRGVGVGVAYFGLVDTELIQDSDDAPGLSRWIEAFPGSMGRPIPAERAANAIVGGVESRSSHVYAPGWVRGLLAFRGQLAMLDRFLPRVPAIAAAIGSDR